MKKIKKGERGGIIKIDQICVTSNSDLSFRKDLVIAINFKLKPMTGKLFLPSKISENLRLEKGFKIKVLTFFIT